ncbi:MAG: GGDEF domain-containing protein [Planctomycetota bacterium]
MSSKIAHPIAAAIAVVCTAILMVAARSVPLGVFLGILAILCISVLYFALMRPPEAGPDEGGKTDADIVATIDKMANGERVDLSSLPGEMGRALDKLAARMETLADDLNEISPRDALTSLAKEDVFNNVLWREFNRAVRYGEPLSVALFELRGIDSVREERGREAADGALRSVSSILLQMIRETDLGARYGDDRLAVIMPGTPPEGVQEFLSRFDRLLEEDKSGLAEAVSGVSIASGAASIPDERIKTAPDLVKIAAGGLSQGAGST